MSVTIERPQTAAQRNVNATAELREIFGFDDPKLLNTAIAEAAIVEARRNPNFAQRVRDFYQELLNVPKRTPARSQRQRKEKRPISRVNPIARVEGYEFDPFAPLDPYFYLKIYGVEQFPILLEEQTLSTLKFAAKKLMDEHPGTRPKTLSKKADVIAYIIELVVPRGV